MVENSVSEKKNIMAAIVRECLKIVTLVFLWHNCGTQRRQVVFHRHFIKNGQCCNAAARRFDQS